MAFADPDWSLYRAFLAVLDTGSLSRAAAQLGLAQPTVGRQIAALEAGLGRPLFTRSPSGLAPTDLARALEPDARAMASAAAALIRRSSGAEEALEGAIRITAAEIVSAEVLPPILTAFHEGHPGVAIELSASNRQEDLLRRDADIAVRMVRPSQDALLARRTGEVKLTLHAHRRYLERHGTPRSIPELAGHSIQGYDRAAPPRGALEAFGIKVDREMMSLRCDSDLTGLAFLRAGFGIAFCQAPIGRRDPDLVPLLADQIALPLEYWVVTHEDPKGVRRVRALFDALVTGLSDYLAG